MLKRSTTTELLAHAPCSMWCAPVLGAGRNGPYMEQDRGKGRVEWMEWAFFLFGNFDCPVELPPCSPSLDCFHNAKGKSTFLSSLAAMIKTIEERGNGTKAAGKVTMITKLVKELRIIGRDQPCTMYASTRLLSQHTSHVGLLNIAAEHQQH
jgi:hypothetical protein